MGTPCLVGLLPGEVRSIADPLLPVIPEGLGAEPDGEAVVRPPLRLARARVCPRRLRPGVAPDLLAGRFPEGAAGQCPWLRRMPVTPCAGACLSVPLPALGRAERGSLRCQAV